MGRSFLDIEYEAKFQLMENRIYIFHPPCDGREGVTYHDSYMDPMAELASIFPGSDVIYRLGLELVPDGDFNLLLLPTVIGGHIQVTAF